MPRDTRPPTNKYPDTAAHVKKLRAKSGLTQEQFADAKGVSMRTLRGWEIGKSRPLKKHLLMLEDE